MCDTLLSLAMRYVVSGISCVLCTLLDEQNVWINAALNLEDTTSYKIGLTVDPK